MLSDQEKLMENMANLEENVRDVLFDRGLHAGSSAPADRDLALRARTDQLAEEWDDLRKMAQLRLDDLKRQKLIQTFFAEAAALEVLISQQDSFLLKQDIPVSFTVIK
ncbi:unnamed protein product [Dibothriocephalus latus]|uniref:Uncharacterized protein n=1 Tax=Dibothriocephalus latus TaxID=60516 RepID=A0A3P7RCH3_DIBLA|nr:unnamed protein product [Dibothriocephalus latus]